MKNKGYLTWGIYIIAALVLIKVFMVLAPLIFLIGLFSIWFYSRKKPNITRRNLAIATTIFALLIVIIVPPQKSKKENVKTNTKTELVNSKKSKKKTKDNQVTDAALSKAESAITDLEKNPGREGINNVSLLINRVKNDTKKQMLQDRLALIEQKVTVNEAETATKLLESNQTKENLDIAKQKIDRITDSNKKDPYLTRINRISEAIKAKEEQEAILANAENVLKKLENNQTRENGLEAQNVINTITDTDQRSSYQKRIDSVISAIESREAQIAAQQVQAAQSTSRHYANCTDMRNAGAAPIAQGQPGYEARLDRDHDGWACE